MPARRRVERDVHQLRRANLFEHQHVRILAQRDARRRQHLVGAAAHFALADEAACRDRATTLISLSIVMT